MIPAFGQYQITLTKLAKKINRNFYIAIAEYDCQNSQKKLKYWQSSSFKI